MFKFLRNSSPIPTLRQLDCLYEQTISKLPVHEQIAYCTRLIERSNYQMLHPCPDADLCFLKKLIKAANLEIQKLQVSPDATH